MNGNQKAMWSIGKRCFVSVADTQGETYDLKNYAPITGFQHLFDRKPNEDAETTNKRIDLEIKTKCIELAIQFIVVGDNNNIGYKVDEIATKLYKFYTTPPQ